MAWYRKLTMQWLMVIILFAMIFAMAVRVPTDTDTWWHIRSGEYIVDNQTIPTTDPFSSSRAGAEWIDHSWGAQVVIYGIYELSGGGTAPGSPGNVGLALFTAVLATLGMLVVYQMCEGSVYVRAFALVIGAAAAAVFWSPRPQMFSFVLGALVLYVLHLYKRGGRNLLWWIPVLVLIWVNLHGGFAIAFILLIGSILGELIGNVLAPGDPHVVRWPRLKPMVLVLLASVPVVAVNPYGLQMLLYPFRTVGIGVLQDFIQEWASPDFHTPQTWPFLVLLLGVLVLVGRTGSRLDWTDAVLLSGTALMALTAGRNIALFAIVAAPVLSRHLHMWLVERGWEIRPMRRVGSRQLVLNWSLLVVILLGTGAKVVTVLTPDAMVAVQEQHLPVEIAAHLREFAPPATFFNSYNWGGYLMFAAPDVPVYVDGRTDLYDDAFLREYLKVAFAQDGWEERLSRRDIRSIAVESQSTLAKVLRTQPGQWQEHQFDNGRSSLFILTTATDE